MGPRISYYVILWITIVIIGPSLKTTNLHESTTLSIGRPGDTYVILYNVIILEYLKVPCLSPVQPIVEVWIPKPPNRNPKFFLILHFQKQTEKQNESESYNSIFGTDLNHLIPHHNIYFNLLNYYII